MIRGAALDPLMVRELRGLSRGWPAHAARLVYVGLVGLILYLFQASTSQASAYLSPSEFANLGRRLFTHFFWPNLILATLAAVLAAADLVSREVRTRTLGILALTPFTSRQIARGKWKAAMAQTLTMISCGAPVLAICFYLGGIGLWEVAWSLGVTASMAALGAAFAVRYSARFASPTRAMLASLLMLAIYSVPCAPFFFMIALVAGSWNLREGRRLLLVILFSVGGLLSCIFPYFTHPGYAVFTTYSDFPGWAIAWIPATLFSFAMAWIILRAAAVDIDRRVAALADVDAPMMDLAPQDPFLLQRQPGRRARFGRADVWEDHPLLWKDMATRAAAHVHPSVKLVLFVSLLLFILLMAVATEGHAVGMAYFFWGIFLLLGILIGATLFVREKESRKFEMLLSAPLTPWQIVRAKLLSGILSPESRRLMILWLLTVLGWSWRKGPSGVLIIAGTSGLFLAFAYVLAALASLRARSMHHAFMAAAGACTLLLVLPFPFLPSHGYGPHSAIEVASSLNPLWVLNALGSETVHDNAYIRFGFFLAGYSTLIPLMVLVIVRSLERAASRT